jgi:tetratricopeptide (TPR) repeat protein
MDAALKSVFAPLPRACCGATLQQPAPDKPMRRRDSKTTDLCDLLSKALQTRRFAQALELYELIETRKPDEPRWAHRKGDLLRRLGRNAEAVLAYERAVQLYSARGFEARAVATAKLLLAIDPSKAAVLERVNPEAARGFDEQSRDATQSRVLHPD